MNFMISDPAAARVLADIIADANRMWPEQVADIITEAGLQGAPDDLENHPVGNYVAHHALLADVAPALYCIVMGEVVTLVNTRTNAILAQADMSGTLADLVALIEDDLDFQNRSGEYMGFGDLIIDDHDPDGMIIAPADRAERDAIAASDDDPAFFSIVTRLRDSIAA